MRKKNQKNKDLNGKKGFSLPELIVAMAVFSIIVLATVGAFGSSMQTQRKAREIQNNVAAAKTAMDLMAKTMRMSKNLSGTASIVHFFNSSQGWCINYRFYDNGEIRQVDTAEDRSLTNPLDCPNFNPPDDIYIPLIPNATGRFEVIETVDTSPFKIGKATFMVKIDDVYLQTSVSFRDYEGIIPND